MGAGRESKPTELRRNYHAEETLPAKHGPRFFRKVPVIGVKTIIGDDPAKVLHRAFDKSQLGLLQARRRIATEPTPQGTSPE